MPVKVDDIRALQTYLKGIVAHAGHHARNVQHVILPLAGAVILYMDPDPSLDVRTFKGEMANQSWIKIGENRYAFTYDHTTQTINMSRSGEVVARFNNLTTSQEIMEVFEGIAGLPNVA
jgi:hypothetical protein